MSRAELADAVNTALDRLYPARNLAAHYVDSRWVGKLERGEHRWPSTERRAALCSALGATGEEELDLFSPRRTDSGPATPTIEGLNTRRHGVDRRTFLTSTLPATGLVSPHGDTLRATLLSNYWQDDPARLSVEEIETTVDAAGAAYQAAEYAKLSALPATIAAAQQLVGTTKGADEVRVWRALARANLVASKLAVKRGDAVLASLTADRASTWAARLCDPVLISAAAYQLTCALTRSRDLADAERVAMTAHDSLARHSLSATAAALSVRGALLLQAAIVAALQGDHATARLRLRGADDLATQVGVDGNEVWTAFGPTNVLLHRLGVAIALGEHARAIQVGRHIDTTTMPAALRSRRAQVHLDLAAAHGRIRTGAAQAVLHLLEAERLAPQVIGTNVDVRVLILFLLHGERRSATPGLRALAQRGGVIP